MTSTIERTIKKDITIIAVTHDDVPESTRTTIYADYFQPFVSELESFIERKVNIVFADGKPHSVFDYKGKDQLKTLKRWEALGYKLLDEMKKKNVDINFLTKVILITHDNLDYKTGGRALMVPYTNGGKFAIASLRSYSFVAHELGHLLGATHDDSEILFNGRFFETYMTPVRRQSRSISFTFSPANRQNIKKYLANKN